MLQPKTEAYYSKYIPSENPKTQHLERKLVKETECIVSVYDADQKSLLLWMIVDEKGEELLH